MKKSRSILFLFTIFLVLGVLFLLLRHNENDTTPSEINFSVNNPQDINRIQLLDKGGTELILDKNTDFWTVNGAYRVQKEQIDLLLKTLKDVRVKYVPPRVAIPAILKDLSVNGLKVNLIDDAGKSINTFYIGGVTSDERGTYAIKEGDDYPYVLHLPYWEGSLRPRFVKPLEEWRDRYFVRADPENITEIKIDYLTQQNSSFTLKVDGQKLLKIEPLIALNERYRDVKPNQRLIEDYIQEFRKVGCEAYLDNEVLLNQLRQNQPFAQVSFTEANEITYLSIHLVRNIPEGIDPERYYVILNEDQLMLTQTRILGKILRPFEYFYAR